MPFSFLLKGFQISSNYFSFHWHFKLKPKKNPVLNGIWTHVCCNTSAAFYQLSYEAIWEMVTLLVQYTSRCWKMQMNNNYIKYHIFELQRKIWRHSWSSQLYAQLISNCEIKAWKKFRPEWDSNPWNSLIICWQWLNAVYMG